MKAWTDFDQIYIGYRMHDDIRLLAATMRGLAYHEGGHCRFTLPFTQLAEAAGHASPTMRVRIHHAWNMLEDQRMETAVVSDSPRKAAYLTPVIMTELTRHRRQRCRQLPADDLASVPPQARCARARASCSWSSTTCRASTARHWPRRGRRVTRYVLADNANDMWAAIVQAKDCSKSRTVSQRRWMTQRWATITRPHRA